jgi:glutamate-5-semialdehyde dehydrogenase
MNSNNIREQAQSVKKGSRSLSAASTQQKRTVLKTLARQIKQNEHTILEANRADLRLAKEKGVRDALLDRLSLENRLSDLIEGVAQIACLPDPVGETIEERRLPNGLEITKRRVPLGVIGVIYESRPNVTLDLASLAILSGNGAILRGGSEAASTNRVLIELIQTSLAKTGLPMEAIQLLETKDRDEIKYLLQQDDSIDLIIPRGSEALQEFCRQHSTIPVVSGGIGICHVFVDESADLDRSLEVVHNAKTQRPAVCNALDTLLVHAAIAETFIPKVLERLKNVSFRTSWDCLHSSCQKAEETDWDTEWLSLVLGIKIVNDLNEALDHIERHGTGHSDAILTENPANAERFVQSVDSAAIYVNASTRFTDGGQFGLGGEAAVSTQKAHARGPMGLKELTSSKWVVRGNYTVRG